MNDYEKRPFTECPYCKGVFTVPNSIRIPADRDILRAIVREVVEEILATPLPRFTAGDLKNAVDIQREIREGGLSWVQPDKPAAQEDPQT